MKPHSSITTTLALTALLLTLTACEKPEKQDPSAATTPQPVQAAPATFRYENSQLSENDQKSVVAVVNGEEFTLGELEGRLNSQAPFARARYNTRERKVDFLNNMVQFEVIADEAQRLGYDKHPEVILEMKQAMVRRMLADQSEKLLKPEDITEDEARKYYDEHRDDYVRPEKVRASHIVVADQATAQKARDYVFEGLKQDGASRRKLFAKQAKELSTDSATAQLGGDMHFFARPADGGTVDPKIAEIAFGLQHVGDISEPFQTAAGWHIVMLTGKKDRFEKTFDEVKRVIMNRLYRERRAAKEKEFIDGLKAKATITVNDSLVERVPDPPADAAQLDPHGHGGEEPAGEAPPLPDPNAQPPQEHP